MHMNIFVIWKGVLLIFVCFMQFNLVNNQEQVAEFVRRGVAWRSVAWRGVVLRCIAWH